MSYASLSPRQDIFYLHFLRCIAAIAVIAIHVLGPYRSMYDAIPYDAWFSAVAINALSRWAVPVFIMISGALLLTSAIEELKPFDARHYLTRRMGKVLIPFLSWSLIYAATSGMLAGDLDKATEAIVGFPSQPVWYHLWFFYDFIPLYFVIPLLAPVLRLMNREQVKIVLAAWFTLTLMHFLKVPTCLRQSLVLYSGYLVLGWYLHNRNNRPQLKLWLVAGAGSALLNLLGSAYASKLTGGYSSLFMGYKSLNTVLIAGMLFVLAQVCADRIGTRLKRVLVSLSTCSLGVYLLHPLLLIPVRATIKQQYDAFGHPALTIPLIVLVTLLLAWGLAALLARVPVVRHLVP
ncbi:acyltransferase [Endozoicomonas lisbonensis]